MPNRGLRISHPWVVLGSVCLFFCLGLSGCGVSGSAPAKSVLSAESVLFGLTPVGTAAPVQTVVLDNGGVASLADIQISMSGSAFSQSSNCNGDLLANQSCTISVGFDPAGPGTFAGTLSVSNSATSTPQVISLAGTAAQPGATISANSIVFPATLVGTKSLPPPIGLTNIGPVPLNISGISLSGASSFVESNTCGAVLAAGQSCSVTVGFDPASSGSFTGSLAIFDNAPGSPQTVSLSGTAGVPGVQLSTTAVAFPNTAIGASSSSPITLTSTGIVPLHISSLSATGTNTQYFGATGNCIGTLQPGASCTITTSFTPLTPSNNSVTMAISDDVPGPPQTVALSGATGMSGIHLDYEMMYLPSYGQSLAQGVDALPVATTSQIYDSLMFVGGVVANANNTLSGSEVYASLVPLVEQVWSITPSSPNYLTLYNLIGSTNTGETPLSGALETIKGLMIRENNVHPSDRSYVFVGSSPAQGGKPIVLLSKGSFPYNLLLSEVVAAKGFAQAQGKTFGVPAVTWTQGEGDAVSLPGLVYETPTSVYAAALTNLFNDLNTDIKAITGQTKDVQFIMYQTFGGIATYGPPAFHIAVAQLQVAQTLPNAHVATPAYPLQNYVSYDVHLSSTGSKQLGGYYGKWFKRIVVDGNTAFKALEPSDSSFKTAGNVVSITLPLDQTPIMIDTTNYTSQTGALPNYGFQLTDASGAAVPISVAITGSDTIQVTASESIQTGFTLTYGASPDGVHGGWGNIRDNQGTIDTVSLPGLGANGTALVMPLHNWLRQFSHTF